MVFGLAGMSVYGPCLIWSQQFALSGALPYLGSSATTIYLAHQAGLAASGVVTNIDPGVALTVFDQALNIQVTYGAVMLSFLGTECLVLFLFTT